MFYILWDVYSAVFWEDLELLLAYSKASIEAQNDGFTISKGNDHLNLIR